MYFLRMVRKLRDRCDPGTYAYATQTHEGWLLRMHVTYNGDPIMDYASVRDVFERDMIRWTRIADPTGDDMDCDWSLRFPQQWKKSRGVFPAKSENEQCFWCARRCRALGYFCNARNKYVSPYMSCKQFAPSQSASTK